MKIKKLFIVIALVIVVLSIGLATVHATNEVKIKKDSGLTIESKEKAVNYKVTWNANGGKIGTKVKVTTVKGSKIGKLVVSPKRTGYTFKGWYTKKNGGKKISTNTKLTKSVTVYAQWVKKGNNINSNIDPKLIGAWEYKFIGVWGTDSYSYFFYNDGKVKFFEMSGTSNLRKEAKFTTSKGKIYLTNVYYVDAMNNKDKTRDKVVEYSIGKDNKGFYLNIGNIMGESNSGEIEKIRPMKFRK